MTEATCSEWLIRGARHCASGQPSYGERQLMLPWLLCVPVAVIRDQLEEHPGEASSSNGRRYNFRHNSLKCSDGVNYRRVKTWWLCFTHC